MDSRHNRSAFTLVEIMIVVAIIGLLAAIAIPSFQKARRTAQINRVANDLRVFSNAFIRYQLDFGLYPPDTHRVLPPKMDEYIKQEKWDDPVLGGFYNWEGPSWGEGGSYTYAGISLESTPAAADIVQELDERIDDGNLATGNFRLAANGRYTFIIEER